MAIGRGVGWLSQQISQGFRSGMTMLGLRPPVQRSPEKDRQLVTEARQVMDLASKTLSDWRGEERPGEGCPGCQKAMVYAANPGGNKVKIVCLECKTKVYLQDASGKDLEQGYQDRQRGKLDNQVLQHEECVDASTQTEPAVEKEPPKQLVRRNSF